MRMRQENWKNASIGNQNLCDLLLLSGRLTGSAGKGGLSTAAEGTAPLRGSKQIHEYIRAGRALTGISGAFVMATRSLRRRPRRETKWLVFLPR